MRISLLAVSAASLIAAVVLSSASAGISPCDGNQVNHLDGAEATGITTYGVKADIEAEDPVLCGSTSFSSAWSFEGPSQNGPGTSWDYWAQVGYAHNGANSSFSGGARYQVFTQWVRADNTPVQLVTNWWGTPAGVANYETSYNFSQLRINMWAAGTQLTHTGYDPANYWAFPWEPNVMGETYHCNTDVPGTASNKVKFSAVQKKSSDGTWSQINDLALPNPDCGSRYHVAWVTEPGSFNIWTDPLN
jgi:hypothetical protein